MSKDERDTIISLLQELQATGEGINRRLDAQEDKLASHDVINAQMTLTQQQLVKDLADRVTPSEFWPVKTIVYAGAGIILVTVFSALIYTVVK